MPKDTLYGSHKAFIISLAVLCVLYAFIMYYTSSSIGMQMSIFGYISVALLSWFFGRTRGIIAAVISLGITAYFSHTISTYTSPLRIILGIVSYFTISILASYVSHLYYELRNTKKQLAEEHRKNELLLENILPRSIAKRLKSGEKLIADSYSESTILFFDLVDFTTLASQRAPEEVVAILNDIICSFDSIVETLHLEKIKTIGDAYLVVSGLPEKRRDHAHAIADMALAMRRKLIETNKKLGLSLQMRIGIHSGPVVGGVIGQKKFTFDLWGDTVNIASRMESQGVPGQIQVSNQTYEYLKKDFVFSQRGTVDLKNRGTMDTWLLEARTGAS